MNTVAIFVDIATDCMKVVVRVDNVSVLLVARDVRDVEDGISVVSIIVLVSDDSVVICVVINEMDIGGIEEEREKKGEKEGEKKGEKEREKEGEKEGEKKGEKEGQEAGGEEGEGEGDRVFVSGRTRNDVKLGNPVE